MHIGQKIRERSKLSWFILFERKKLIQKKSLKLPRNDKIFIFFTTDLEYNPKYPKKASYDGFKNYLEILQTNNIPSTFFVCGDFAMDNKKDIIDLSNNENEIGSHSYNHINLGPNVWWGKKFIPSVGYETRKKSILKNHEVLSKILKRDPVSFRAPYLSIDGITLKILNKAGYKIDSSVNNFLFGLPTVPYHPSKNNTLKDGDINIIEFFITCSLSKTFGIKSLNLDYKRITFFNSNDLPKDIKIVNENMYLSPYIVILTHPWEFSRYFKSNPNERINVLSDFIHTLKKDFNVEFLRIEDIFTVQDK